MVLSGPAKSGLENSAWIDGYDYQNKDKKHYHYEELVSVINHSNNHVIPRRVIAVILDVILNISQR